MTYEDEDNIGNQIMDDEVEGEFDDGIVDFDRIEEKLQGNQPGRENGLQNVQVMLTGGNHLYFNAKLKVCIDLMARWHDYSTWDGEPVDDEEPPTRVWAAVTGAYCTTIDFKNVTGIQTRPAGNYRDRDGGNRGRSNYNGPNRGGYGGNRGGYDNNRGGGGYRRNNY